MRAFISTLVIALVTAGIAFWSHERSLRLDQEKFTFERSEGEEKIKREHQDEYIHRMAEVKKANYQLAENGSNYWAVAMRNDCDSKIYVATRYRALDGSIFVRGWYNIEPQETARIFQTKGVIFYVYAKDSKGRLWTGDASIKLSKRKPFEYIDDDFFENGWYPLPDEETVKFLKIRIDADTYGDWVLPFTCN